MPAKHIGEVDFEESVLRADKPILVDFFADWCGPCKMAGPVLDELTDEAQGKYEVVKINIDQNQPLAQEYGVMSIPTVILFKDGKEVDRKIGFGGKEGYKELLSKAK
jgi:thioredoxin 1